ncbi:unnamed protein product [Mesocestoides corti]|uniref:SH2 domain-containing protein n=2 Tax=Mesocestoides corti TaxID=53468 RepID=A0A0R3UNE9_MESCO|nr:unnamed protein product [Mesocestoides corti]
MDDSSILATYLIQYIGCIPVTVSIRSLDFFQRTQVARGCITRVCEDVGLKVPLSTSSSKNELSRYIGKATNLTWTRQSVRLSISVDAVTVQDFHTEQVLFHHRLGSISFASSGEADMMDFVSYIAKSDVEGCRRMCYVFYCSGGCSREFISSIGEAFKLGYKGFKESQQAQELHVQPPRPVIDDFEPPLTFAPAAPESADPWFTSENTKTAANNRLFEDQFDDVAWLLQDEPAQAPPHGQCNAFPANHHTQDPFTPVTDNGKTKSKPTEASLEPVGEPWYVGRVTRQKAESLLQYDGDFLVRASTQQPNQFVLSGMQNGKKRHLLLINPEGQVRTKDRIFSSIQELIDFHLRSTTPIRSADSELKLVFPVTPNALDQ